MIPQYHQQLQNYPDQLQANDNNQLFVQNQNMQTQLFEPHYQKQSYYENQQQQHQQHQQQQHLNMLQNQNLNHTHILQQQNNQQKEQHTLQESQLQQKLQIEQQQQQQRLLNEHLQRQQQFQITQLPYHTIKSQNSDVILTIQPLRNAASTSNLYSTTKPKPVTRNSFSNNNQNLLGINMLGNTSTIGNRSELLLSSQRHQRDLFSGELGIPEIKTHVGSVVHTFETMAMLQDRINKSKLEPILISQSDQNPFNDNEESLLSSINNNQNNYQQTINIIQPSESTISQFSFSKSKYDQLKQKLNENRIKKSGNYLGNPKNLQKAEQNVNNSLNLTTNSPSSSKYNSNSVQFNSGPQYCPENIALACAKPTFPENVIHNYEINLNKTLNSNLTPEDQTKNYSRNTVVGRNMEQSDNSIKNSQPVRKKKRSYKSCPPPPPPVNRNIEQLKAKDRETETKEISTNQYEYHHAQHHNSTTDNIEDEVVNKAFKDIFISYGDGDELDDENSFEEIYQHNTMPITSQNQEKLIMKRDRTEESSHNFKSSPSKILQHSIHNQKNKALLSELIEREKINKTKNNKIISDNALEIENLNENPKQNLNNVTITNAATKFKKKSPKTLTKREHTIKEKKLQNHSKQLLSKQQKNPNLSYRIEDINSDDEENMGILSRTTNTITRTKQRPTATSKTTKDNLTAMHTNQASLKKYSNYPLHVNEGVNSDESDVYYDDISQKVRHDDNESFLRGSTLSKSFIKNVIKYPSFLKKKSKKSKQLPSTLNEKSTRADYKHEKSIRKSKQKFLTHSMAEIESRKLEEKEKKSQNPNSIVHLPGCRLSSTTSQINIIKGQNPYDQKQRHIHCHLQDNREKKSINKEKFSMNSTNIDAPTACTKVIVNRMSDTSTGNPLILHKDKQLKQSHQQQQQKKIIYRNPLFSSPPSVDTIQRQKKIINNNSKMNKQKFSSTITATKLKLQQTPKLNDVKKMQSSSISSLTLSSSSSSPQPPPSSSKSPLISIENVNKNRNSHIDDNDNDNHDDKNDELKSGNYVHDNNDDNIDDGKYNIDNDKKSDIFNNENESLDDSNGFKLTTATVKNCQHWSNVTDENLIKSQKPIFNTKNKIDKSLQNKNRKVTVKDNNDDRSLTGKSIPSLFGRRLVEAKYNLKRVNKEKQKNNEKNIEIFKPKVFDMAEL